MISVLYDGTKGHSFPLEKGQLRSTIQREGGRGKGRGGGSVFSLTSPARKSRKSSGGKVTVLPQRWLWGKRKKNHSAGPLWRGY